MAAQAAPRRPSAIVDREAEWEALVRLWRSRRPELAFVVGRRRVGKSYLLAHFAHAVKGLYYQATRRTEAEQLARLSLLVGERFDDPGLRAGVPFPDWEAMVRYLVERARGRPYLFVLDEFPYLVEAAPALPSILQALWDQVVPGTRLKLVLSGSHVTVMRRLEEADQALYGRRTGRLDIQPFGYGHVGAFVPDYSGADRLRVYGIFGGLPGHLSLLEPELSLGDNVARQVLDPGGRLHDDAQHMLDAFLGDTGVHYSILEAIALGEETWSGITKRVGKGGGSVSRPMRWLEAMQIVERQVPVTEARPEKSKRARYRLRDPYIAFWHRFVAPLVASGDAGRVPAAVLWRERVQPQLDDYMGRVFEQACLDFVAGGAGLPFRPHRVGAWWDSASRHEIGVVALGPEGRVLVGECKWGVVGEGDLASLRERATVLATELKGVREIHLALFSGREGTAAADSHVRAEARAGRVLLRTGADLLVE